MQNECGKMLSLARYIISLDIYTVKVESVSLICILWLS